MDIQNSFLDGSEVLGIRSEFLSNDAIRKKRGLLPDPGPATVSSMRRISCGMSRVDSCTRVIAINSRGIPSGGFVYGLLHLIAN